MIGKTILHYKILDKIGEGGMGVVYKAEDTKLKRTVALKFLPEGLTRDEEARKRFIQEAQAAAALDHPHICTVYDIAEAEGQTFIAMAYIEGQSLKEKIKLGPMDVEEALSIAVQVAEGLKEAHEKGIVHRDIKPGNIMMTKRGQAKIMDFGLAKLEWGVDLTKTATIMGTVAYMSPEQAKGEKIDHRTDIWSLGAMIYEMLTGRLPFKPTHDQALLYSILNEDPAPMTEIRKDIPRDLERIARKCIEKDPKKRFADTAALLADLRSVGRAAVSVAGKPSIAVLPFVNMSPDPENEYFSDGLAEELINALTKITDLHVVARTSSFAFKGEKLDARQIGQKLNVDHLLEGSVRKAGNRVRITAQLIKAEDGYHLWSERYDRDMEDVFAIQDEITEKIVGNLRTTLKVPLEVHEGRRPASLEAYDLYLKGRYYWSNFSPGVINKAIASYNQAIEKDPDYALPYVALAEAYVTLSTGFDILPTKDAMPKAREAAQKALALAPTLAEAHVALGLVATCYDWDRRAAKSHFQKALELNPNSVYAHQWTEFYLTFLEGEFEDGKAHLERAQEMDPLNLLIKVRLGYMYFYMRDFDRAIEAHRRIVDFAPKNPLGYHGLMDAYGQKGMYEEAIAMGEKALELGTRAVAHLGVLGHYYAKGGRKDKAYALLHELEERSQKGYVSSFWTGVIYFGLGKMDKAFSWLEKAYEERDGNLIYCTVTAPFDPIRPDPRYKRLLNRMGLSHLIGKFPDIAN
ncbi:MAG: protein kinase [Candidatus Aminicenantales bacterium]